MHSFETFLVYNALENRRERNSSIEYDMMMMMQGGGNSAAVAARGTKSTILEYSAIVRLLQNYGNDPNLYCRILKSMTPLHWEVAGRETMKSLAKFPVMNHGWTPLHCATLAGSTEMVDIILNMTESPEEDIISSLNDDFHTSISIARETGKRKILFGSTLAGSVEVVDLISKVDKSSQEDTLNNLNDDCHTSITIARKIGKKKILRRLLKARLDKKSEWLDQQPYKIS